MKHRSPDGRDFFRCSFINPFSKNPEKMKHLISRAFVCLALLLCSGLSAQIENGTFQLIDTRTDEVIRTFDDSFTHYLSEADSINIVAIPINSYSKVSFTVSDGHSRTEGVAPYACWGDVFGDYGFVPGYTDYYGFGPSVGALNFTVNYKSGSTTVATDTFTITFEENPPQQTAGSLWNQTGQNIHYSQGQVGIGTNSPGAPLTVKGNSGTTVVGEYPTATTKGDVTQEIINTNNSIFFGNAKGVNDRKAWILARHSNVSSFGKYYSTLHLQPDIGDKSAYKGIAVGYQASTNLPLGTHLAVNGKVGIGTANPDMKLTVKGNIHAEEIKVDLSVPAPDYVFTSNYDLSSLEDLQEYINENGHLPNIPSAEEMEENGIELGGMNIKLLEKIEELTLYILNQESRIKALESKIKTK